MTKTEIFIQLNELTSYFSFGRILGKIVYEENIGIRNQLERSIKSENERIINTEIELLVGLWLSNVNILKNWNEKDDSKYIHEVYSLMYCLHQTFRPSLHTPIPDQLKEIAFYEGDQAYDWQLIKYAMKKYEDKELSPLLEKDFNYNISYIKSTYYKIIKYIEENVTRWRYEEHDDLASPIDIFIIKKDDYNSIFNNEEKSIIKQFTFKLGKSEALKITDIGDRNSFKLSPIIEMPSEKGYLVLNNQTLAISMNESPLYWILDTKKIKVEELGNIKGKISENLVYGVLATQLFPSQIYKNVTISSDRKGSNNKTDIDIMTIVENTVIIYQIKSKKLSELSKKGIAKNIISDAEKGVLKAYEQGKISVECLKNQEDYTISSNIPNLKECNFYNICITTEQYPTISSIEFIKSKEIGKNDLPIICLSLYDLEILFLLFKSHELINYLEFRSNCAKHDIYGLSEVYYIGLFLECSAKSKPYPCNYKIPRIYGVIVDWIIKRIRYDDISIVDLNEVFLLMEQCPIKIT